ncbi:MAG: DUF2141 domain-containing protein [Marinifilaceae bacterium]
MRVKLISLVIAIFAINSAFAQNGKTITVNITGIKGKEGLIMVALYNSEDTFLKKTFRASFSKIKNKKSEIVFKDVPSGSYAISCFYDKNSNKKMDFNILGIPKEQYGMSNNARGFMGPPSFKDAKFDITFKDVVQDIKL